MPPVAVAREGKIPATPYSSGLKNELPRYGPTRITRLDAHLRVKLSEGVESKFGRQVHRITLGSADFSLRKRLPGRQTVVYVTPAPITSAESPRRDRRWSVSTATRVIFFASFTKIHRCAPIAHAVSLRSYDAVRTRAPGLASRRPGCFPYFLEKADQGFQYLLCAGCTAESSRSKERLSTICSPLRMKTHLAVLASPAKFSYQGSCRGAHLAIINPLIFVAIIEIWRPSALLGVVDCGASRLR